jgi:translation initiation factor IF-3
MEVKQKRALKFLKKGYKVSVEIILKGREKMFLDKAKEVLENFIKRLEPSVSFDQPIKKSPNGFNAVIKNAEKI